MSNGKILEVYDPTKELANFKMPSIDLLRYIPTKELNIDIKEQDENKMRITETLEKYGIAIKKIDVRVGPTITLFEIIPADGVRISKIKGLEDDIQKLTDAKIKELEGIGAAKEKDIMSI